MSVFNLLAILAIVLCAWGVGYWGSRRSKGKDDFYSSHTDTDDDQEEEEG